MGKYGVSTCDTHHLFQVRTEDGIVDLDSGHVGYPREGLSELVGGKKGAKSGVSRRDVLTIITRRLRASTIL